MRPLTIREAPRPGVTGGGFLPPALTTVFMGIILDKVGIESIELIR